MQLRRVRAAISSLISARLVFSASSRLNQLSIPFCPQPRPFPVASTNSSVVNPREPHSHSQHILHYILPYHTCTHATQSVPSNGHPRRFYVHFQSFLPLIQLLYRNDKSFKPITTVLITISQSHNLIPNGERKTYLFPESAAHHTSVSVLEGIETALFSQELADGSREYQAAHSCSWFLLEGRKRTRQPDA